MIPLALVAGSLGRQDSVKSVGPFIVSETTHQTHFSAATHVHERASVNIVLQGGYAETYRGSSGVWPIDSVIAKPAWAEHLNQFGNFSARCLLLEIQAGMLDTVPGAAEFFSLPTVRDGRKLRQLIGVVCHDRTANDEVASIALEASTYELISAFSSSARLSEERRPDRWLIRVREILHEVSTPSSSLQAIAQDVGRHPSHVARTFRARHGCTIGQYVRRLRIESAAVLLKTSRLSVSAIALRSGFYDHAHFCREFRHLTGMHPSGYRAELTGR